MPKTCPPHCRPLESVEQDVELEVELVVVAVVVAIVVVVASLKLVVEPSAFEASTALAQRQPQRRRLAHHCC